MPVYLVQHGKSFSKEIDPERKLTVEGKADVQRIADVAKHYGINVQCIKHSGKKRAEETADIFAAFLNPQEGIEEISGLNPMDDVTIFAKSISSDDNNMYVGHLPFMEKLVSFLTAGDKEKRVLKFQNCGIVCLDKDDSSDGWFIKWTLMPEIK